MIADSSKMLNSSGQVPAPEHQESGRNQHVLNGLVIHRLRSGLRRVWWMVSAPIDILRARLPRCQHSSQGLDYNRLLVGISLLREAEFGPLLYALLVTIKEVDWVRSADVL